MAEKDNKSGGCFSTIFLLVIIVVVIGGCSACMHRGNNSSDSHPRTHLTKKQKEKQKAKKIEKQNEKNNFNSLKKALAKIPDKTKGEITEAKVDEDGMSINLTLSDECISGSDAQVRKIAKETWQIGVNYAKKYGPYPDGKIDADDPLVYVQDSAGNELGRSSAFGDFKWEG